MTMNIDAFDCGETICEHRGDCKITWMKTSRTFTPNITVSIQNTAREGAPEVIEGVITCHDFKSLL